MVLVVVFTEYCHVVNVHAWMLVLYIIECMKFVEDPQLLKEF